jgi:hypothetical protein
MDLSKTTLAIFASAALAVAIIPSLMTGAFAAISTSNTGCSNNGGNSPGGQQPTCSGGGLTQETTNANPAGSAPPGQNK